MATIYGTTTEENRMIYRGVNFAEMDFLRDTNLLTEYNTKRLLHRTEFGVKGIPYIFFTTPMLNLTKDNCNADSFLSYMAAMNPELLSLLNFGTSTDKLYATSSPFIKLLSNTAMNFNAKDSVSKTKEVGETFYGYKLTLPGADIDSIVGDEISIKYRDLPDIPVLKLHKAWFDYHNAVRRGHLVPNRDAILNHYIDYTSSIYYFLCGMDGQTIEYFCKLTGVAPINVPYSTFSSDWQSHELIEYDVQYVYSFKEDMNPDILLDFNKLASGSSDLTLNFKDNNGTALIPGGSQKVGFDFQIPENNKTSYEKSPKAMPLVVLANNSWEDKKKFKLVFLDGKSSTGGVQYE